MDEYNFFLNLKQAQFESQLFHLWSKDNSLKILQFFFICEIRSKNHYSYRRPVYDYFNCFAPLKSFLIFMTVCSRIMLNKLIGF